MPATRYLIIACAGAAALIFASDAARAQTYGFASMQPRLHQSHHQLRHLQGAEGKGRSQHPGAADRRQIRDDRDRRPRRGRFRHGERAGDRDGTRQRRAARPAHDRRGLCVEDRLLGAQGQQHARRLRSARQARDDGLLRHARARSAVARHPRDRRPHREGHQAGAGPQRGPLGATISPPARPTCSCSRSARRRCARST